MQRRNLMADDISPWTNIRRDGSRPRHVVVVNHVFVGPDSRVVDGVLGDFEEFKFVDVDGTKVRIVIRGHPGGYGAFVAM